VSSTFERDPISNTWRTVIVPTPSHYILKPEAVGEKWFVYERDGLSPVDPSGYSRNSAFLCKTGPDPFGRMTCQGIGEDYFVFRGDTGRYIAYRSESYLLTDNEWIELSRRTDGVSDKVMLKAPRMEIGTCRPD